MPTFYNKLVHNWAKDKDKMTTHNYGLADKEYTFDVPKDALKNSQATFIEDFKSGNFDKNNVETSMIKTFDYAIQDAGGEKPTLIHMNCEGCEWDLLPGAIDSGFIDGIQVLQLGFHNYGEVGLGQRAIQYCKIRKELSKTYMLDFAVPFAWEQWILK